MARKNNKGRQRIEIVKMQNEANLQVTFCKRRNGLFKKANELCTLTGAEVAVIVFSPSKKAFSFGSSSVESIIGRTRTQSPQPFSYANKLLQTPRKIKLESLNNIFEYIEKQLKIEKVFGEKLNQLNGVHQNQNWWEAPTEELSFEQLQQLKLSMENLRDRISNEPGTVVNEEKFSDFLDARFMEKKAYGKDDPLFDIPCNGILDYFDGPINFEAPGTFDFSENVAGPTRYKGGSPWISWESSSNSSADFNSMASGVGGSEMPHAFVHDYDPPLL